MVLRRYPYLQVECWTWPRQLRFIGLQSLQFCVWCSKFNMKADLFLRVIILQWQLSCVPPIPFLEQFPMAQASVGSGQQSQQPVLPTTISPSGQNGLVWRHAEPHIFLQQPQHPSPPVGASLTRQVGFTCLHISGHSCTAKLLSTKYMAITTIVAIDFMFICELTGLAKSMVKSIYYGIILTFLGIL